MYCKCICTHHNNASIYKANGNSHKRGNQQQCTIGRDFNMPLTSPFRSSKQKVNKKIQVLNDTLDQINLIDIYRTIHQETIEHNFFSSAHGLFSRIDHILGHKSSLNKFMKIEFPHYPTPTESKHLFSISMTLFVPCKEVHLYYFSRFHVVVVQSPSCVQLFATPWTIARQAPLFFTISWSLFKFMSVEPVMLSNHLIFCYPLLLLPSIFPSIRGFSHESVLHTR